MVAGAAGRICGCGGLVSRCGAAGWLLRDSRARRGDRGQWLSDNRMVLGHAMPSGSNEEREAPQGASSCFMRQPAECDDGIMLLFCPTSQIDFVKSEARKNPMPAMGRLLCMGLFSRFLLSGPKGPEPDLCRLARAR